MPKVKPSRTKNTPEKKKKIKDKNAPKKPANAYLIYCAENRENIKTQNPDLKPTEIVKKISENWNLLNEKLKDKYKKLAEDAKNKYIEQLKEYIPVIEEENDCNEKKQKKCTKSKRKIK